MRFVATTRPMRCGRHRPRRWGHGRSKRALAVDITDEASIVRLVEAMDAADYVPNLVLNCTGVLHTDDFGPERSWRHLDIDVMRRVFDVNALGVGLLGKHLIPRFARDQRGVFASLSARVGSIGDNRLGGWYSYRASKAAQNMIVKTLSIEASMKWKDLICVALHPGTVETALSEPFTARVPPHKLFTPEVSPGHLSASSQGSRRRTPAVSSRGTLSPSSTDQGLQPCLDCSRKTNKEAHRSHRGEAEQALYCGRVTCGRSPRSPPRWRRWRTSVAMRQSGVPRLLSRSNVFADRLVCFQVLGFLDGGPVRLVLESNLGSRGRPWSA